MKTSATRRPQPALFALEEDPPPAPPPAPAPQPAPPPVGVQARLVVTTRADPTDPQRRPQVLLVVECPYCQHLHIHPGGCVGALRLGERQARCVGRPSAGLRYFVAGVAR